MTTQTKQTTATVADIMTRKLDSVHFNAPVAEALTLMVDTGHNTMPVVDNRGQCVGILSRSDLTETLLQEDQELTRLLGASEFHQLNASLIDTCQEKLVREVMTHDIQTVTAETTVQEACKLMAEHGIHHLPVTSPPKRLEGFVSTFDIMRWLAQQP